MARAAQNRSTCFINQKGIQPYFPLISFGCKTSFAAKSFRKRRVTLFTSRVVFLPKPLAISFHANSLVFASPDDLVHDWKAISTDLEWIADIPGVKWFEYEKGVKVNGKQCKWRNGKKVKNGHWTENIT